MRYFMIFVTHRLQAFFLVIVLIPTYTFCMYVSLSEWTASYSDSLAKPSVFKDGVLTHILKTEENPNTLYFYAGLLKRRTYGDEKPVIQRNMLLKRAAQLGNPAALYEYQSEGAAELGNTESFRKAAYCGHLHAQYEMGLRALKSEDYENAYAWFCRAAQPRIMMNSGFNLERGQFVLSSYTSVFNPAVKKREEAREALEIQRRFQTLYSQAQAGDLEAQYCIVPYLIKRDPTNAMRFFETAEENFLSKVSSNFHDRLAYDRSDVTLVQTSGAYGAVELLANQGSYLAYYILGCAHLNRSLCQCGLYSTKKGEMLRSIAFLLGALKNSGRIAASDQRKKVQTDIRERLGHAHLMLASEFASEENFTAAIENLKCSVGYDPHNEIVRLDLGTKCLAYGQQNEDEALCKKGLVLLRELGDKGQGEALYLLGRYSFKQENINQAIEDLCRASEQGHEKATRLLCRCYSKQENYTSALQLFKKVFDGSARDFFERGMYYYNLEDYVQAHANWIRATEMKNYEAAAGIAWLYLEGYILSDNNVHEMNVSSYHKALEYLIRAINQGAIGPDGGYETLFVQGIFEHSIAKFAVWALNSKSKESKGKLRFLCWLLRNNGRNYEIFLQG